MYLSGAESTNRVMCLVPIITWLEDIIFLHHYKSMFTWIVVLEVIGITFKFHIMTKDIAASYAQLNIAGLVLVVTGLYLSSLHQEQSTLQGAHAQLLPDYVSEVCICLFMMCSRIVNLIFSA